MKLDTQQRQELADLVTSILTGFLEIRELAGKIQTGMQYLDKSDPIRQELELFLSQANALNGKMGLTIQGTTFKFEGEQMTTTSLVSLLIQMRGESETKKSNQG